jgi:ABC-type transport system substrate-binding protein
MSQAESVAAAEAAADGPPDEAVVAAFDGPLTCDPHAALESNSRVVVLNVYEPLVRYDASRRAVVPWLASALPVPSRRGRGVSFVVNVRGGIRDHHGRPITNEDVVYSLRRSLASTPGTARLWVEALFGKPASSASVGEVVRAAERVRLERAGVTIALDRPFPPFPYLLAHTSLTVSRRWAAENGEWSGDLGELERHVFAVGGGLARATNGTGPFRLDEWKPDEGVVTLSRNEDYWGPAPMLRRVTVLAVPDDTARERALVESRVDFAVCQPEALPRLREARGVRVELYPDEWYVNPVGLLTWRLDPGCEAVGSGTFDGHGFRADGLTDGHLRRALASSFDYDRFVRELLGGISVPHFGPIPHAAFGGAGAPPPPQPVYDLDAARDELRRAWGGRAAAQGFRLLAYTHRHNELRVAAARLHAECFNQLVPGCTMEVREVPLAELLDGFHAGRCPIAWFGWDADYCHPYAFASQVLAESGALSRGLARRLRRLTRQALRAATPDEERAAYAAIGSEALDATMHVFVPGRVSFLPCGRRWAAMRFRDGTANVLDFASFVPARER